jgi:hypothetical protein
MLVGGVVLVAEGGCYLPGVFDVGRNIAAVLYGCPYDRPETGEL